MECSTDPACHLAHFNLWLCCLWLNFKLVCLWAHLQWNQCQWPHGKEIFTISSCLWLLSAWQVNRSHTDFTSEAVTCSIFVVVKKTFAWKLVLRTIFGHPNCNLKCMRHVLHIILIFLLPETCLQYRNKNNLLYRRQDSGTQNSKCLRHAFFSSKRLEVYSKDGQCEPRGISYWYYLVSDIFYWKTYPKMSIFGTHDLSHLWRTDKSPNVITTWS